MSRRPERPVGFPDHADTGPRNRGHSAHGRHLPPVTGRRRPDRAHDNFQEWMGRIMVFLMVGSVLWFVSGCWM